ncbi:MAG: hypothetical protein ABIP55_02470 [Tepidisphaeraceae bacterium]
MLSGCQLLGVAAYKLTPPPTVQPKYTALAEQSIGVMVWTDQGLRIEWPGLRLDLANAVQTKFKAELAKKKPPKALIGVSFPVLPASIVRYQMDHPDELEAMPITDVAPKLGVQRLIYLEVEDFVTRGDQSVDLFRGMAKVTVRVLEITGGKSTIAFEKSGVAAAFPPKAPAEGIPNAGDYRIYVGTLDALASEIVHLFVPYQQEEW